MQPLVGPDQKVRRRVHIEGMKRGRTALSLRWINDSGKRCHVVEDVNLQPGSEEWLICRHLKVNGNHI